MNEEEKKAVEFIRDLITWDVRQDLCPNKEECKNLEIILNLIEKLQKENEELENEKKETMDYEKEYKKMKIRYNKLLEELVNENYEKEYKKMQSRYNKLLDENKKLNKVLVNLDLKVK